MNSKKYNQSRAVYFLEGNTIINVHVSGAGDIAQGHRTCMASAKSWVWVLIPKTNKQTHTIKKSMYLITELQNTWHQNRDNCKDKIVGEFNILLSVTDTIDNRQEKVE